MHSSLLFDVDFWSSLLIVFITMMSPVHNIRVTLPLYTNAEYVVKISASSGAFANTFWLYPHGTSNEKPNLNTKFIIFATETARLLGACFSIFVSVRRSRNCTRLATAIRKDARATAILKPMKTSKRTNRKRPKYMTHRLQVHPPGTEGSANGLG